MKKLQNKQRLDSVKPNKNWCIDLPKSFNQYPIGGFSNYVTEIGLISLAQRSLSISILDKTTVKDKN